MPSEASRCRQRPSAARLRSLIDYRVLGTKPGKGFDNITRMAPEICQSPIALISLVDEKREWFKSKVDLEASYIILEPKIARESGSKY